jgi:peptidyl-prolyl cis-trans isomerase A (cyclophilin A)
MRRLTTLAVTVLLAACGGKPQEPAADPAAVTPAEAPKAEAPAAPAPAEPAKVEPAPAAPAPVEPVAAPTPAPAPADPAAAPTAPVAPADPAAAPAGAAPVAPAGEPSPALLDPSKATEQAPATFKVKVTTTKGPFVIEAYRDWAPLGVDRFYNLVKIGYFKDLAFFRAIEGFMVQFGIHGDPKVSAAWREARIQDDAVRNSNLRGHVTFATAGPNTRTTQFFINFVDNRNLDGMGFAAFGKIVEGMDIVDGLHKGYGEGFPNGNGPDQSRLQQEGNPYLKKDFPALDYIVSAELLP